MDSPRRSVASSASSSNTLPMSSPRPKALTKTTLKAKPPSLPTSASGTPRKLQARSQMVPPKQSPLSASSANRTSLSARSAGKSLNPTGSLVSIKSKNDLVVDKYSDDEKIKDTNEQNAASSLARRRNNNQYRGGGELLRLPLEYLSKAEIRESLHQGTTPIPLIGFEEESEEEEEIEDLANDSAPPGPDRARFNVWKGVNYDLHVLGEFKSTFEKNVKAFQKPEMKLVSMDPFCRSEKGLEEEPPHSDAFLIWKSKTANEWLEFGPSVQDINTKKKRSQNAVAPFVEDLVISSDSDDDTDSCCSTTSFADPEIKDYILCQKQKRKQGLNVTGESIYFDEEFGVIRNLHRDSYSMTNYGVMPDERFIGKAHIFYPEMTKAEKNMLHAFEVGNESRDTLTKKKSSKTISVKTPRSARESIVGDGTSMTKESKIKEKGSNHSGDFVLKPVQTQ